MIGRILNACVSVFYRKHTGVLLELLYRNLTREKPGWVNPGFCTGPYLPIYGFGLCALFLLASLERYHFWEDPLWDRIALFLAMAVGMTLIEYVSGLFCLKFLKVRLWDYSDLPGNIQGIICPQFSAAWAVLGAIYYFLIHPHILEGLAWLSRNLAFSFFIGMFFGIFLLDAVHSAGLVVRLKQFAEENQVIVRYEALKEHILAVHTQRQEKYRFFRPFRELVPIREYLKQMQEELEQRVRKEKRND